jgi:cobalt-zinc-cadmium efflux system protein
MAIFWLVIEAVVRLLHPVPIVSELVVIFASIGLIANISSIIILHRCGQQDINVKSAIVHIWGDFLGYLAVIVATILVHFFSWLRLDPLVSIIFALLIIKSNWSIAKDAVHILMEGTPENFNAKTMVEELKKAIPTVKDMHHIHAWSLTHDNVMLTAHVKIRKGVDQTKIADDIRSFLKNKFAIHHSTIEVELIDD